MIKSFEKFNESLADLFKDDRTVEEKFYDRVKDCLIDIITNQQQISEKSFTQYDVVIAKVKEIMQSEKNAINEMMGDTNVAMQCRPAYWAERIYQELLKRAVIDTDQTNL